MNLKILLPQGIFLDLEVTKVVVEAVHGSFCLLSRHVDVVTALVPGVLSLEASGEEEFIALDEGILVKQGSRIWISVQGAVRGPRLGDLKKMVTERFRALDEQEKKTRTILARFESDFINRFIDWRKSG